MIRCREVALAAVLLVWAMVMPQARAAPEAQLWAKWLAHDPAGSMQADHGPWQDFLDDYLRVGQDGINRVAYGGVSAADRGALSLYLKTLQSQLPRLMTRDEQRAFWINLYNAQTVAVILAHYPVDSIRDIDISPGLFSNGPWGRELLRIDGEDLSLDDVEHRILRPIWQDPRIHYAVNCAALGCPNLQPEAFTATNGERLLEAGAVGFVNHPRGVSVIGRGLRLSSIYKWFREDFGESESGLLSHLRRHARAPLAEVLLGDPPIVDYRYDWSLNDAVSE